MGIAVFRKINARKDRNLVTLYFNKLLQFKLSCPERYFVSVREYYTLLYTSCQCITAEIIIAKA